MFCKNCGKELNNGAKVCPNCGTKVITTNSLISILKQGRYIWQGESEVNQSDCCIDPVPEDVKSQMRQNFGIDYSVW